MSPRRVSRAHWRNGPMELADLLLELRRRMGWTQAEMAEDLGVSTRTVSGWERGETVPPADVIRALAIGAETNVSVGRDGWQI